MNQFPQMMPHTMGVAPQFAPGTIMPGTGMFLPPPPIGLPMGMSPGLLGMVPPGTMLPNQMQPVTIAVPPRPEDTIANNVSASEIKVATTVFVGNISDKATDTLIRQILLRCGVINAWKRVQGASGKMQAFGFCEYSDPEATLRALRLLHKFKLGDKTLVVKVDSKTRKELVEYIARKKLVRTGASEEEIKSAVGSMEDSGDGPLDEELDEITKDADVKIMDSINQLVRDNVDVLTTSRTVEEEGLLKSVEESLLHMAKQSGKADENATDLTDVDMEDDMKHIVSDEIRRFRQSYKEKEEQKLAERMKEKDSDKSTERNQGDEKDKDREKSSRREHDRDRKDHAVERSHDRNRERQRSRDRSPIERGSRRDSTRMAADRGKDRTNKEKEREKSFRDEEAYEQRRVDKRQRERDTAYKERLKHWETRERKKLKEYEREKLKEDEKQEEMEKDKKHLAEFLEDYDDDKDDNRYYKGSAFARRRREREIELDSDEKDRQHEREEIEALRHNMMKKQVEGTEPEDEEDSDAHSDIDMKEEEDIPLSKDSEESFNATVSSTYPPIQVQSAPNVSPTFKPVKDASQSPDPSHYITPPNEVVDEEYKPKLAFGLKSGSTTSTTITTTSKRSTLEKVFNQEDEELFIAKKQRKLVPIEYSEEEQQAVGRSNHMSSDERKGLVQNLIKSIPTEKDELFAYNVKWDCLDDVLIEKRVKPWINKKIIEYIGEEETTLVEFIADKVSNHSSAQNVLDDVSMVLDEDTEVFVVKLWRLLIYETEAKHRGLSKNYQ